MPNVVEQGGVAVHIIAEAGVGNLVVRVVTKGEPTRGSQVIRWVVGEGLGSVPAHVPPLASSPYDNM